MGTVVTSGSTLYFVTGSIDEDGSNITTNAIAARWEVDPADNNSVQLTIPKEITGTSNDRIAFYISGSGRVGIGTKDPQAAFDVRDTYDTGAYTKIGRIVHFGGKVEITATGGKSDGGEVRLTLPFTCATLDDEAHVGVGSCNLYNITGLSSAYSTVLLVSGGGTYMRISYTNGSGVDTSLNTSNFTHTSAWEMDFQISYIAA